MATKNDITGDTIQSRTTNKAYEEGWDRIFGNKQKEPQKEPQKVLRKTEKTPVLTPEHYTNNQSKKT